MLSVMRLQPNLDSRLCTPKVCHTSVTDLINICKVLVNEIFWTCVFLLCGCIGMQVWEDIIVVLEFSEVFYGKELFNDTKGVL